MSAWLVTREHIHLIVAGALALEVYDAEKADELGHLLWHENRLSLEARYSDIVLDPKYTWDKKPFHIDAANLSYLYKQLSCYGYQSCEHDGWELSGAYHLTEQMMPRAMARWHAEQIENMLPNGKSWAWGHDDEPEPYAQDHYVFLDTSTPSGMVVQKELEDAAGILN